MSKMNKTVATGLISLVTILGCAEPDEGVHDEDAHVSELAWRYLELEVDEHESHMIVNEVKALAPDELRL